MPDHNKASLGLFHIDVGCFHRHNLAALPEEERKGFEVTSIAEEPLVLVWPAQHLTALRSQVPLACLNRANFVLPLSTKLFGLRGQIDELLKHNHCTPAIVQEAAWITTVLSLGAGGVGVSLLPANLTQLQRQGGFRSSS